MRDADAAGTNQAEVRVARSGGRDVRAPRNTTRSRALDSTPLLA